MVSALDSGPNGPGSSPGRGIVLCPWARHFTLAVPLSTQEYKINGTSDQMLGVTCNGLASQATETGISSGSCGQLCTWRLNFTAALIPSYMLYLPTHTHYACVTRLRIENIDHIRQCSEVVGTSSAMFGSRRKFFWNSGNMDTKITRIRLRKSWQV